MGKKSRKQSDKSSPGGKAAKVGQAAQTGKQSSASRQAKRSSSAKQTSAKPSDARSDDFPIVGVGASAGGLEALKGLLDAIPDEPGVALVVIQHLDPTKSSLTAELLDKHTKMEVTQVDNDVVVHVNHVYVIPPNKSLDIQAGKLQLSDPRQRRGVRVPIDIFLRSLADDQGERAVAVILSGTGSDGTLGAKAVKTAGGLVIAQQPESAGHPGMPQSVIETGIVDQVLPPSKISKVLVAYAQHSFMRTPQDESKQVGSSRADLSTIMALLRTRAKFDLRCYKETTLLRRTRRRMGLLGIHSQSEYCDYLREHDDEVRALMKDLLISVTDFFRDPEAWETLEEQAIAPLVKGKGNGEPVRVWIPGSATGEEAFSVAMLLNEQVQGDQKDCPLQIFASDVDKEALEYARQARYPLSIAAEVSPARLKRYFEADGDHHYQIKKNIREAVVFAEQNLVSDPPFSNLDLVCCRNLLIYLKPEIQQKLIALFHFALREGGFLFLGNAETIGSRAELFEIVSKKWRIYRWLDATRHDIIGFPVADQSARRELETIPPAGNRRGSRLSQLAQQRLIDWIAPQAVLIDRRWQILYYCGDTDPFLTHAPGSPTQDVLAKCRQGLRSKLRAAVQRALKDGDTISVQARVKHHRHFEPVRVTARPVRDQENDDTLVLVRFEFESAVPARQAGAAGTEAVAATHDADARQSGRRGADSARRAGAGDTDIDADEVVRQLEEELAETKEDLHTTIEQLEASNEEFKASNEEVMSMNEELQSTNEELETSKEELQSLNEELNTVNSQLASKVDDLERANNDLSNLIRSTEIPTICLDLELRIKWFTPAATSLVRIVASDIGRPLADFSHKLANDNLLPDAQRVLDHLTPIESEVVVQQDSVVASLPTPDGWRTYLRRIVPYRTEDNRIDGVVITLVDISERKRAQALIEVKELAETIIDTVRDPMLVLDSDLNVVSANETFYRAFQVQPSDTLGTMVYDLGNGQWNTAELRKLLDSVLQDNTSFSDYEVEHEFELIGRRVMLLNGRRVERHELILLAIDDVTALRDSERQIAERVALLDILHDVAEAANRAQTVEEAMLASLRRICDYNHWRVGHVWRLAEDGTHEMVSSGIWQVRDAQQQNLKEWQRHIAETRVRRGEGLIGRVMQSGQAEWVEDIAEHKHLPIDDVEQLGLQAAIAFPVTLEAQVVAVIEFLSDRAMEREERFMEIMPSVGIHLGQVIERKRLEKSIADATSEQQRHFGRELHDSVLQELTGIGMMAQTLWQKLSQESSPLDEEARHLVDHLRSANLQVSRLAHGLMPVDVDAEGLMTALEGLVEQCNEMHQTACVFECSERIVVEDNDTATHLYRIAQEATQNAHKHGSPERITVRLATEDGAVVLTIQDDGVGLPAEPTDGAGLRIMQYRANLIGARLEIKSHPGQGVTVRCRLKGTAPE